MLYIKIENNKLIDCVVTQSNEMKQLHLANGYVEISDDAVEQAYDGAWYLIGFAPAAPAPTYTQLRAAAYPETTEQLDKLYHDIDGGLFGDAAKTSAFYLARKEVKEAYPKVEVADENKPQADETAEGAESPKGESAPSEQGETTK